MKNPKAIGITVIVLAIMNMALLIFLWMGYRHNQTLLRRNNGAGLIVLAERLELNQEQKNQLEGLRREHFRKMDPLRRQSHETRELLHTQWSNENKSQVDSLTVQLGFLQTEIEKTTFQHFAEIRALCNPEQKIVFDRIIKDILKQGERPERPQGRGTEQGPPPRR